MANLTNKGYEHINEVNNKYKISQFAITNMEEYDEWRDDFWHVYYDSDIINIEDARYIFMLDIKLDYSSAEDRNL